jgi:serine/threonine-protein kinase
MEPVLSALAAAHRAGLVHRDVKPENILLSDDGVVKVADFGLARAVESDAAATRTGLMMGTVAYCAPEQISEGRADPRSDVYSAGVVLFELLTGAPPYKGESAMNVAYQHVHSRVPAPSSRVKTVPYELDEVVVAATDSDPEGRPSDAGSFLAELADVRADLDLPVVPVPARTRPPGRPVRSEVVNRTADAATTDSIRRSRVESDTAVVPRQEVGVGQPLPLVPRDDNAPPPPVVIPPPKPKAPPHIRRRRRALLVVVLVLLLGAAAGYAGWWFAAGRYSRVPEVVGKTRQAAIAALDQAGYKWRLQPGPEFDPDVPKGAVLRTEPDANTRLVKGRTVTIVISAGPHFYAVPPVRGKTPEEARSALEAVATDPSLTVADEIKSEYSDAVPQGKVTRTDPPAGNRVTADQPITIYVSKGPAIVDVPYIAPGTAFTDARATLKQSAGQFQIHKVEEYSDSFGAGEVISVDPSDHATKFSTITVTVSKGPEFVQVPDIAANSAVTDAEQAITDAGLVPDVQTVGAGDPTTVLAISPAAGARVHTGSTVTIYALTG